MGLRLLLFTQLYLKVKRSQSRSAGRKGILTWNSHSRSFEVIHFAITGRQRVAYRHIILLASSLKLPKN